MIKKISPSFKIDKIGMKKVWKGLLIGIGGLILTALVQLQPLFDLGHWNPIVITVCAAIVNFGRKFLMSYK